QHRHMGGAHRPDVRPVTRHRRSVATRSRSARRPHPPPPRSRLAASLPRPPSPPLEIQPVEDVPLLADALLFLEGPSPRVAIPDLEHIDLPREDHVALDARVVAQVLRDEDAALAVERALVRAADVDVLELLHAPVESALGEDAGLELRPRRERVD